MDNYRVNKSQSKATCPNCGVSHSLTPDEVEGGFIARVGGHTRYEWDGECINCGVRANLPVALPEPLGAPAPC